MVKAKFYVREITEYAWNKGARQIVLAPVSRGEENKEWAAATPSGEIKLTINNELAATQFEIGKEYSITFEPAS